MKFKNGLFNPTYGYIRAIAGIVLGIVLIVWPSGTLDALVRVIGCFLICLGIFSWIGSAKKEKNAAEAKTEGSNFKIMQINGIFDIVLGLILAIIPGVFVSFLTIVFGILLLLFGISQLSSLFAARKSTQIKWTLFVMPALVTICGAVLIFMPKDFTNAIVIITGAAILLYGISELISTLKLRKVAKFENLGDTKVEDVEYEEVK